MIICYASRQKQNQSDANLLNGRACSLVLMSLNCVVRVLDCRWEGALPSLVVVGGFSAGGVLDLLCHFSNQSI